MRVPGWAQGRPVPSDLYRYAEAGAATFSLAVNGAPVKPEIVQGFAVLRRTWKAGDAVELSLPMPVRRVLSHEKVAADAGRVALERGPVVYCAEAVDNGGRAFNLVLPDDAPLQAAYRKDLLGGVTVVTGRALALQASEDGRSVATREQDFLAVPYHVWAHRGDGRDGGLAAPAREAGLRGALRAQRAARRAVPREDLAQPVVREAEHPVAVDADHRLAGHEGVEDRLLRRLHRGGEERVHGRRSAAPGRGPPTSRAPSPGFAVEKATKRSPEPFMDTLPVRARPIAARRARRSHWCGRSGASVAIDDDDRARLVVAEGALRDLPPDRHAGHRELPPQAEVRLDQDAERCSRRAAPRAAGRTLPDPALELEADHAGAAAHAPFLDRAAARLVEGAEHVGFLDVEAVDVVQPAVRRSRRPPGRPQGWAPAPRRFCQRDDGVARQRPRCGCW